MRIKKFIIFVFSCFIAVHSMAQNEQPENTVYHKFSLYAGVGPSYFFNNLHAFKDDVNSLGYAISFRAMWEPQHSFLSLGIESGYFRLYSVSSTVTTSNGTSSAHVTNSSVPIMLVVSMKFSRMTSVTTLSKSCVQEENCLKKSPSVPSSANKMQQT